jgi:hypothetical protein
MYREIIRDLNDAEREVLQKRIEAAASLVSGRDTIKWVFIWLGAIGLVVLLAIGLILLKPNLMVGGMLGGALLLAGILCVYVIIALITSYFHWDRVSRRFKDDMLPLLEGTLKEGKVLSKDVTATTVIEIVQSEDEGSAYIFALEDSRSLLLKGQRFVPAKEDMPWPAAAFSVVRSRDGKLWVGVFSAYRRLDPIQSLSMEACVEGFRWSEREDLVEGSPEDVLRSVLETGQL